MPKSQGIRMGANLGFIEKIILTDGTALYNMQVLYRSPIPAEQALGKIFEAANRVSREYLGPATPQWSQCPESMEGNQIFNKRMEIN